MGAGKQEAMVVEMPNSSSQNPIAQLQNKFKELEIGFKGWLSKQSIPVEAAVVTATSGLQGAAIGGFMGTLTQDVSSAMPTPPAGANLNPQAMASFQQAQVLFLLVLYCFIYSKVLLKIIVENLSLCSL